MTDKNNERGCFRLTDDVEGKFTGKKEKGCQQTPLQILY